MNAGKSIRALLIALAALFVFRHPLEKVLLSHQRVPVPDAAADPIQTEASVDPIEVPAGGHRYRLTRRFRWDESASVVSVERYRLDRAAPLIPYDFALAWGPLLVPPYQGRVAYDQMNRWYFYHYHDPGLDRAVILSHSANTHVIPSTVRLRLAAACVSRGDTVRLEGWLVDADGVDDPGFHWTTSTTRVDEGPGSCETVYLTRLTINASAYE